MSEKVCVLLIINIILSSAAAAVSSHDRLTKSESILGLNQTLVSAAQIYEAGFFNPKGAEPDKTYFGIWYYNLSDNVRTVVWVANRDAPARDPSSVVLKFAGHDGGQVIITQRDAVIWSSNNASNDVVNPVLQLLDTGNLVIRESDHLEYYVWQSFDYPTDTLLPNQKLGWSQNTGLDRRLIPWNNTGDPALGNYSITLTRTGIPELLVKQGTKIIYRVGWIMAQGLLSLFNAPDEVYLMFTLTDPSIRSRFVVDPSGTFRGYTWNPNSRAWSLFWIYPKNQCDTYMECGTYGVCDVRKPFLCDCPQGFIPMAMDPAGWSSSDRSDGCVRRTRLGCGTDRFVMMSNMSVPMSGAATVDTTKGLEECREACQKNCNCTAYTIAQVIDGLIRSGCLMWMGDLLDMSVLEDVVGQDLYVRLAAADLALVGIGNSNDSKITKKQTKKGTNKVVIGIGVSVAAATTFLVAIIATSFVCKTKNKTGSTISTKDLLIHNGANDLDLPLYGFDAIVAATNNFAHENKLGEGGFGCVYKGVLKGGEEIAVKRLSKGSRQGAEEFKNEVNLIAKLQHKNLVRLLGYCVERDEKMLIYEYLPNQSLDFVLFNKERCLLLNWQTRFDIICGIARGLLYLHHDSRLKIIHRDLKASNVLLDNEMNPKISDFGMARIFKGDETRPNNTKRVVGTYGYMSPEYVMDGVFSIKSDVFSFGVLMLEIVTGKKTRAICTSQQALHLIGYAWKMWEEGRGAELLDPSMGDSYTLHEVLKCIQVGLLCVQAQAKDRPTMLTVVMLLSSETTSLPQPKLPGFYLGWGPDSNLKQQDESFTINQVTNSTVDVR